MAPAGTRLFSTSFSPFPSEALHLCGLTGIETATIENQAAYLQGWIKVLQGDSKLLVQAGGKAQKAVGLITGETFEQAPEEESAAA